MTPAILILRGAQHADLRAAEQAISLVASPKTKPGRYRAPDPLLAFLEGL
jgi:hypothetical protein